MSTLSPSHYEARSSYLLPRSESEQERLDDQHKYATVVLFESRLIYDEDVILTPGNKVLDAGAGTGIWLQDLSKQVPPTVDLFGCDVSSSNFPAQYPDNVHFHVSSVTSLPEEWSGIFDFVNQRFLVAGLRISEWPLAISELHRVLKPGGHIQLADVDLEHLVNPGPATKRFVDLCAVLFNKVGLLLEGSNRLDSLLKEAQFTDIRVEKKYLVLGKARGRMGELGKHDFSRAFRNYGPAFVQHGVVGTEEEVHSLVDDLEEEWDSMDEGFRVIAHVAIARKALYEY